MTNLLLRRFVRNYHHPADPAVRAAVGKMAGMTGILCNCLLFAVKLAVGLLTGSVAVIADGVNNLSDTASSVVTLLGFWLARRPADREHPYGHARYGGGCIYAEFGKRRAFDCDEKQHCGRQSARGDLQQR